MSPPRPAFDTLARRADGARAAGRLDEAMALYRQAIRLRPSWPEGQWAIGTILYELDEYKDARAAFERVVVLQPENGAARAFAGLCAFQLHDYAAALEALQRGRALGLGASAELGPVVAYHVGLLLTRSEQYELAFETLRELAARDSENPGLTEAIGLALLRVPLLPADAPVPDRERIVLAGRAGMLMAGGRRSAAARAAFEDLERRFPADASVRYAFGAYLVADEPDAALAEFQRALSLDPGHVAALLQIAFEQIKRGQAREAADTAEKAVALAPGFFAAHNALGRALLDAGDVDRAVAELEAGTKLAPDSPDMYFALARAYQRAGRTRDAERARATFLELDRAARSGRSGPQAVGGREPSPPPP